MATISAHTHTHTHMVLKSFGDPSILNYATQLENLQLPSEETALNFQYWDVSSCNTLFHGQYWSFRQNSAPAHKARTTQQWQEKNIPDFISTLDWPSASPDLNPLNYKLWSKLQEVACK